MPLKVLNRLFVFPGSRFCFEGSQIPALSCFLIVSFVSTTGIRRTSIFVSCCLDIEPHAIGVGEALARARATLQ